MNLCRIAVNCLAVLVGLFGVLMALGTLMILVQVASGTLAFGISPESKSLIIGYVALVTLFGGLGFYLLRTAWKHMRKSQLNTANKVAGTFSFVLALCMLAIFGPIIGKPKSNEPQDATSFMALQLAVIVAVYLFHRFVLKRIAARGFPSDVTSPQI